MIDMSVLPDADLMRNVRRIPSLGDARVSNDDASYTGETGDSSLSLQYYRNKAAEFQHTIDAMGLAYDSMVDLVANPDTPDDLKNDLLDMLDEYDSKKTQFRLTAEAINGAAAAINAAGGRMPEIMIPSGLGLLPFVIPAAAVAAFAAIAGLTAFAITWLNGYNERLQQQLLIDSATPEQKALIVDKLTESKTAIALAQNSGLFGGSSTISNIVKYAGIAFIAYLAWQAYDKHVKG